MKAGLHGGLGPERPLDDEMAVQGSVLLVLEDDDLHKYSVEERSL